jgi:hypothetical protein
MARHLLAGTVAVLAVLASPAANAYGATASPSCSDGNLSTADVSGSPTSVKAGAAIIDSTRLTNTTTVTLSNVSFILALLPPPGVHSGNGTPALAWRVDGGSWHTFGLSWTSPAGSGADWQSRVQFVGAALAPHASLTLDIRTEFATASPNGDYQYDLAYSADPCSMNELGMNFEFSQYVQGWTQPRPSPSTHKPSPSPSTTHHAVRTSAATTSTPTHRVTAKSSPSPSHSQSQRPSPSPSLSPSLVPQTPSTSAAAGTATPGKRATALIGAQDAAAARSHAGMSTFVIALLTAVLLAGAGLYAGWRARRRKNG